MQPQELYFRGSLVQYWNVIYAEWKRLGTALGQDEPFRLNTTVDFVPNEYETLPITFLDEQHQHEIVTVFADQLLGKKVVTLTVFFEQEAFEKSGEAALSKWNKVRSALERDGRLVDPLVRYQPKKKRGMQLGTEYKLKQLRELRLGAIKNKRPIPTKKAAMGAVRITYKTWVAHDKELWAGWDVESYR